MVNKPCEANLSKNKKAGNLLFYLPFVFVSFYLLRSKLAVCFYLYVIA